MTDRCGSQNTTTHLGRQLVGHCAVHKRNIFDWDVVEWVGGSTGESKSDTAMVWSKIKMSLYLSDLSRETQLIVCVCGRGAHDDSAQT